MSARRSALGARLVPLPLPLYALCVLCVSGCGVTPLTNKIRPGEEPFVVVVGEGSDGFTDLFAAPAGGGTFHQLTFNRLVEQSPRLSPAGRSLAFIRRRDSLDADAELVVLDLATTSETTARLPTGSRPERLGWSVDGAMIYLAGARMLAVPVPLRSVGSPSHDADSAVADSLTRPLLGDPVFAEVRVCSEGGWCVIAGGRATPLGSDVSDPLRWGTDSVAYIRQGSIEIRPLGGGRARRPVWTRPPANIRQPTHHPGAAAR